MEEIRMLRRDSEMQQLWQAYHALQQGSCQLRFIAGEAGTGKSVLLEQFTMELEESTENTFVASTFCSIRSEYSIFIPIGTVLGAIGQHFSGEEEEKPVLNLS